MEFYRRSIRTPKAGVQPQGQKSVVLGVPTGLPVLRTGVIGVIQCPLSIVKALRPSGYEWYHNWGRPIALIPGADSHQLFFGACTKNELMRCRVRRLLHFGQRTRFESCSEMVIFSENLLPHLAQM